MASALLASRNEPCWGEHKVYTRKNPYPNPIHCSNPNLNPNFNQIHNEHAPDRQDHFYPMESDDPAEPAAAAAAASDDSSSFSRKPADLGHRSDSGGYVTFNISTYSRKELRELKRRLISELDQVRSISSRIESWELQSSVRSVGYSTSTAYGGGREVTSSAAFPLIAGVDVSVNRSAPKADQFYHPAEIKKQPATTTSAPELTKLHTAMMKKCSQILTKLMKHKGGVWFNSPVDVVGMGLHDYHQIIKNPMDLGTVKSNLSKGFYTSPLEFASDIRLTFKNALLYNPQGHEVHRFADLLLRQFEGSFGPAYAKHEKQRAAIVRQVEEEKQRMSSWARVVPVPDSVVRAEPALVFSPPPVQTPRLQPPLPVQPQPKPQQQLPPQQPAMKMVKHLPKPKVNDANKRAMSREEREKLSDAIQNLPEEKMSEVLQIVSKRNVTSQNGDEVEIDFALMDNETLWELDRFVTNWSKMMSKMKKRQKNLASDNNFQDPSSATAPPLSLPSDAGNKSPVAGVAPEAQLAKKSKKGDPVDEDVDIGDEMPATNYPSVEIEKESSSSSSGSDSSSSSDSDSGSSSGSDSDDSDDDARSPAVGSGRSPVRS